MEEKNMVDIDGIESVKILFVDDDVEYSNITAMYLKSSGLNITVYNDPIEALEYCKNNKIDIILLDYYMDGMTGKEFLTELRRFDKRSVVILQTTATEEHPPLEMMISLNIQGYFDKSKSVEDLLLMILSTVKTVSLLLYRANRDTNNIEYSFMSIGDEDVDSEISVDQEDDIKLVELDSNDNGDIETNGFYKISLVNISNEEQMQEAKAKIFKKDND